MINYSYAQIEKAVRGELLVPTRRARFKGNVSLDTRTLQEGDLYIPLTGKNHDGHQYIQEAFKKGARACFVEYGSKIKVSRTQGDVIFVDNTLQALGRLAAFHRRRFNVPVIAVTGSCGKTTTKDLIAHLLGKQFRVLKSEGSENNYVGVPKTMLRMDGHDMVVLELGSNQLGEIRHLSRLCYPTHGVLTMIGNAHLSGFRNIQGVRDEKMAMVDILDDGASFIYNADDKNITHRRFRRLKCVRVGFSKKFEYFADHVELLEDGAQFQLNGKESIHTELLGRHNIVNVLLAIGTAVNLGFKESSLKEAVDSFTPPKGRVRYQEIGGIHWIDDSYNSNPTSLRAAIELFKMYPPKGRKILVLGDMLELGSRASLFHREAGESIAGFPFDMVLTVGEFSKNLAQAAKKKGFDAKKINSFSTSDEAGSFLKNQLIEQDTVLLKGSRGMRMEKVLEICSA